MIEHIIHHSKTANDEMSGISNWMNTMSKNLNPSLVFDLKKYHPQSWHF
ncbi:MAG: hypothetical protein IPO24_18605 [Bacteroidetes bacterium]|nr:hypothetical protein [Bacteroidota bacterium]